jgi:hypothetical protein
MSFVNRHSLQSRTQRGFSRDLHIRHFISINVHAAIKCALTRKKPADALFPRK